MKRYIVDGFSDATYAKEKIIILAHYIRMCQAVVKALINLRIHKGHFLSKCKNYYQVFEKGFKCIEGLNGGVHGGISGCGSGRGSGTGV